jgi:hypothetical protein
MKVKYVMQDMNPLKRDMMDGDLKTYVSQKRLKLSEALEKMKNKPGLASAIMKRLAKHGGGFGSIEDFIDALNLAGEHGKGLYDYSIKIKGDATTLIFEIGEMYFVVDGMVKAQLPRFHKKSHDSTDISKEAWLKWFEKELGKYHPREKWIRTILEGNIGGD